MPRLRLSQPMDKPSLGLDDAERLATAGILGRHAGVTAGQVLATGATVMATKEPVTLFDSTTYSIKTTGEIPRIVEKEFLPKYFLIQEGDKYVLDEYPDDQALIIEKKGVHAFILLGCCHAGLENTINKAKALTGLPIKAIVGGFHLNGAADGTLTSKLDALETLASDLPAKDRLILRPTHCSGERFYMLLKTRGSKQLDIDRLPVGSRLIV